MHEDHCNKLYIEITYNFKNMETRIIIMIYLYIKSLISIYNKLYMEIMYNLFNYI